MPAIITKGAFSAQGYGFGASAAGAATYIEDVFSTYLFTAPSSSTSYDMGIDFSTKGGMIWTQVRSTGYSSQIFDTARGNNNYLAANNTNANSSSTNMLSFSSTGFTGNANLLISGQSSVAWGFRKQPKFFDIVTYTGDGVAGRQVTHNLGSTPGMIIVKCTTQSSGANWVVWHRSLNGGTGNGYLYLNNTSAAAADDGTFWGNGTSFIAPTSSYFTVNNISNYTNATGQSYVAYIYAHNAGGFGAAGTDNVISCGSFTDDGVGNVNVTLGWEPQYILVKRTSAAQDWFVFDTMRGASYASANYLKPNLANAEATFSGTSMVPTATGFTSTGTFSGTYIYMAIRRGPMKTPTDATKVFSPITSSAAQSTQQTTNFPVDLQIETNTGISAAKFFVDRLRGVQTVVTTTGTSRYLASNNTDAEANASLANNWNNTGFAIPAQFTSTASIYWSFARAPGFFDEVCYTGTGVARNIQHNLGVPPELIITKQRSGTQFWCVFPTNFAPGNVMDFSNAAMANYGSSYWASAPTSTTYNIGTDGSINFNTGTYVAYLFATCPGVSKVGSYTGTGAAQNINCGFAASARFILIKRTDSTGDWYVYDSARGISASNDPYLLLNTIGAQVTNTDYVGTYASGFALTSTAPAALNANGGSFIFLAVA